MASTHRSEDVRDWFDVQARSASVSASLGHLQAHVARPASRPKSLRRGATGRLSRTEAAR